MTALISSEDLGEILSHALEEGAFIFLEVTDSLPEEQGEVVQAHLSLNGAISCELTLCASVEFAEVIAANLLGVEPGDEEALGKGSDAIGEILNIVAGIVMDRYGGGELRLTIGTPIVTVTTMDEHLSFVGNHLSRCLLVSDDGFWIDMASVPALGAG